MDNYKVIECSSAKDFLNKISPFGELFYNKERESSWVFRGQTNNQHKLLPSIFRENNNNYNSIFENIHTKLIEGVDDLYAAIINTTKSLKNVEENKKERLTEIIKFSFVELHLVEKFILECNKIRLYIPTLKLFKNQYSESDSSSYFYYNLREHTDHFIKLQTFFEPDNLDNKCICCSIKSNNFLELDDLDVVEAFALARHHGLPNRLLDWTTNPFHAAYFSAGATNNKESKSNKFISVWALDRKYITSDYLHGSIRYHENLKHYGLEFLHIQQGLFTEMIGIKKHYYENGTWPTLDEYLLTTYLNPRTNKPYPQEHYLKRIDLDNRETPELLEQLDKMGINKHTLMPSYDNVVKSIKFSEF